MFVIIMHLDEFQKYFAIFQRSFDFRSGPYHALISEWLVTYEALETRTLDRFLTFEYFPACPSALPKGAVQMHGHSCGTELFELFCYKFLGSEPTVKKYVLSASMF